MLTATTSSATETRASPSQSPAQGTGVAETCGVAGGVVESVGVPVGSGALGVAEGGADVAEASAVGVVAAVVSGVGDGGGDTDTVAAGVCVAQVQQPPNGPPSLGRHSAPSPQLGFCIHRPQSRARQPARIVGQGTHSSLQ